VKISFEKKLPDHASLHCLLDGTIAATDSYTRFMQEGKEIVAAYDGDTLVGVGGFRKCADDAEAAAEWAVVIHPSYVKRDIEHNMKKLVRQ
jgi:hypothetical protein